MNIYLLTRPERLAPDWDEWISAVVIAENDDEARKLHPMNLYFVDGVWVGTRSDGSTYTMDTKSWIHPSEVIVQKIGVVTADLPQFEKRQVVIGSSL